MLLQCGSTLDEHMSLGNNVLALSGPNNNYDIARVKMMIMKSYAIQWCNS